MDNRERAMRFIILAVKNIFYTENKNSNKYESLWKAVKKYRVKFISIEDVDGTSISRMETFRTNNDNDKILTILKLAYNLLDTNSYNFLLVNKNAAKISAMQAGKGVFNIMIEFVENNLRVIVETVTNK